MDMDRLPGAMLLFILLEIAFISKRVWRFITAPSQISLDAELTSIIKNSKKTIISMDIDLRIYRVCSLYSKKRELIHPKM